MHKSFGQTAITACVAGLLLAGCSTSAESYVDETTFDNDASEVVLEAPKFSASVSALDGVPGTESVSTFNLLSEINAPEIDTSSLESLVADALAYGQNIGFLFYNVSSGQGIAFNIDEDIYGASSFKAPYSLFVCEELVESGEVLLDEPMSTYYNYARLGGNYLANIETYVDDNPVSLNLTVADYISLAIRDSNNTAFMTLRYAFDMNDFEEWISEFGVKNHAYDMMTSYPVYSARQSAKLWTEMYLYFEKETSTSEFLRNNCANTSISFIRDGITGEASVYNKAGWIAGGYLANSTTDAAVIECDGETYVMSIMSDMPYSAASGNLLSQIAAELFSYREMLIA